MEFDSCDNVDSGVVGTVLVALGEGPVRKVAKAITAATSRITVTRRATLFPETKFRLLKQDQERYFEFESIPSKDAGQRDLFLCARPNGPSM
jgi:hypothetical protein